MFNYRSIESNELLKANLPLICWSDEPNGMEKRIIQTKLLKTKMNSPAFVEFEVDMFDTEEKLEASTIMSKGYIEKFYFIANIVLQ